MFFFTSLLIGVMLELTGAKPASEAKYATKYDHLDVEMILNNRRMVNYYAACLLSQGPCPPEGVEFKRILPEALSTNCGRCTKKQATVTLRAIRRLKKEYPKIWTQLSQQWDPDDIYIKKFESTFGSKNKIPADKIDSNAATAPQERPSTTTINSITASPDYNIIRISSSNSTSTESPILTSTTSTATSTITTSTTSTRTTARLPLPIPGLLPINTFFTNPPIPLRPIAGLGANIGATVMAIKQVEKAVAYIALMKINTIKSMVLAPWRKT
ncbi:uncharacterized protein [Euwallacea fornicatus]|uniref:uncharacterized protein isoform X2 n=1 Tax=Euwallacea fornicatus TaxID=995702 RepID=UPI00338F5072